MRGLRRRRSGLESASVTDRPVALTDITATILTPVRLTDITARGGFRTASSSARVRGTAGAGVVGAVAGDMVEVGVMVAAGATGTGITEVVASLAGVMPAEATPAADTVAAQFAVEVDSTEEADFMAVVGSMAEAVSMVVVADAGKHSP